MEDTQWQTLLYISSVWNSFRSRYFFDYTLLSSSYVEIFFFFHSWMSLSVRVVLFYVFFGRDIRCNFLSNHNRKRQEKFEIKWKGKSLLLIIPLFCIKPYWLAYKSGRYSRSLLELIFSGHIYVNKGLSFIYIFQHIIHQIIIQGSLLAKLPKWFLFLSSDKSSKRDYVFSEICKKYPFTMGHPNIDILGFICKSNLSDNLTEELLLYSVFQQ